MMALNLISLIRETNLALLRRKLVRLQIILDLDINMEIATMM